jgi:hypothetical protein
MSQNDSATNERAIKKRNAQQRRDRVTDEVITKQLMSTPDGRRWVWMRLEEAKIFVGDENLEPYNMAFSKGVRNAGLRLLNDVSRFTPQEYIQMTTEATAIKLVSEPEEEIADE